MSLKAGGVGINLAVASNAFVLVSTTLQLPFLISGVRKRLALYKIAEKNYSDFPFLSDNEEIIDFSFVRNGWNLPC